MQFGPIPQSLEFRTRIKRYIWNKRIDGILRDVKRKHLHPDGLYELLPMESPSFNNINHIRFQRDLEDIQLDPNQRAVSDEDILCLFTQQEW
jgi:hypothetical protein